MTELEKDHNKQALGQDMPDLQEELQGMQGEAQLLADFLDIPSVSGGWFKPVGADRTSLTVSRDVQHHNIIDTGFCLPTVLQLAQALP